MSLLLEALKKAELAKQQQAAQQGGGDDTTLPITTTRSGDQLRDAPSLEPLMTRDRLPDIDAPLELLAEQLPAGEATRSPPLDLSLTDTLPPGRAAQPTLSSLSPELTIGAAAATTALGAGAAASARTEAKEPPQKPKPWAQPQADDRETARRVFEAKTADYNPRRPFYIALGALGVIAAGAVGYFWWELQPRSNFASAPPPAARPATTVASQPTPTPPPGTAGAPGAPGTSTPVTSAPQTTGGAITAPPESASLRVPADGARTPPAPIEVARPTPTPPMAASRTPAVGAPSVPQPPQPRLVESRPRPVEPAMTSTAPRIAVARSAPGAAGRPEPSTVAPPITVTRPQPRLDPAVEEAYNAFQAGDLTRAQELYQRAAQSDPTNRDVQLGLAAIDLRSDRINNAEARYARLLELDPRDPHAQAGIAAIRGGADPIQSESRLKTMIAQQPDAGLLHFALGNQYAAQLRWSEAQQEYFRAFTSDPENPDFAFNLAVSLDQIRQPKLALEYYQRALNLANARPSAFDRTRVSTRVQELQR